MRADLFRGLDRSLWPAVDLATWAAAQDGGAFVFGGGGASSWRPGTIKTVEKDYGCWLRWLSRRGERDPVVSPAARATLERIRAYHADLVAAGYAPYTIGGRLKHLGDALRVMDPDVATKFINRGAGLLNSRATRVTPIAGRMRSTKELDGLGRQLMEQATAATEPTWKAAVTFRDGLLISFWIARPLRISNIADLYLGRSLTKVGGDWRFSFEAKDMKANKQFGGTWPQHLVQDLETYLDQYRPILAGRAGAGPVAKGLWLSSRGGTLKLDSVAGVIGDRTKKAFGVSVNPHLARHIVATEIAENRPTQVTDIAAVLGHSSMVTSEMYYNKAGPHRAARRYDKILQAKRVKRPTRRPRRRDDDQV